MEDQQKIDGLRAIVSGIVSVLTGAAQYFGIASEWLSPFFLGQIVTAITGLVAAYYAGKKIARKENSAVQS